MRRDFKVYKAIGHRFVGGFLQPEVLSIVGVLDSIQRQHAISGAVVEIGVHHGKFFIGLRLLQRAGESSVAIDVFSEQELNIDGSGNGDQDVFLANVTFWSSVDDVVVHRGDSTLLEAARLRELAGSGVRLFSVDGGHTMETVLSDLKLAAASLEDGGIVIADDVFNEHWPGVCVGTLTYLEQDSRLTPFFIGFNKVFLTTPEYRDTYRAALESAFGGRLRTSMVSSVFAGHEVGIIGRAHRGAAVGLLRRSPAVRSIYHRANRGMARASLLLSKRETDTK